MEHHGFDESATALDLVAQAARIMGIHVVRVVLAYAEIQSGEIAIPGTLLDSKGPPLEVQGAHQQSILPERLPTKENLNCHVGERES